MEESLDGMALSSPYQSAFEAETRTYFSDLVGEEILVVLRSALRLGHTDALWKTHLADLHFGYDRHADTLQRRFSFITGHVDTTQNLADANQIAPDLVAGLINYVGPMQLAPAPPPFGPNDIFIGIICHFYPTSKGDGLQPVSFLYPAWCDPPTFGARFLGLEDLSILPDWVAHLKKNLEGDLPRSIEDIFCDDMTACHGPRAGELLRDLLAEEAE